MLVRPLPLCMSYATSMLTWRGEYARASDSISVVSMAYATTMLTWRGECDSATMTAFIPSCIMWSFCVAISLASDPTYSYHHHVLSVGLPVSDVLATAPTDLLLALAHKHPLCSWEMIGLTLVWPDWLDVCGLLVATSKLSRGTSSN